MASQNRWIIPDDWDGSTYAPYLMCVPLSSKWIGTVGGALYELSRAYNWEGHPPDTINAAAAGLEVYESMCCLDSVITALEGIQDSIDNVAQASCGACGSEVDPESESTPPVGPGQPWPDINSYDTYKCRGANWVIDGLLDLFAKLELYDVSYWTTTTISAGAGLITSVILTTVLGGWVVVVAGAVVAMVTKLILGTTIDLSDIKTVLTSERADLICALYNGSDADSSRSALEGVLSSGGLNVAETELVGLVLTNSVMNQLYEFNAEIDVWPETTSCAGCGPQPCPYTVVHGVGVPTYDQQSFVMQSVPFSTYHTLNLASPSTGPGCSAGNWCVQFKSTDITIPEGTFSRQLWCWKTATTYGNSSWPGAFPPLDTSLSAASIQFNSATPFSVTMKIDAKLGFCAVNPAGGC